MLRQSIDQVAFTVKLLLRSSGECKAGRQQRPDHRSNVTQHTSKYVQRQYEYKYKIWVCTLAVKTRTVLPRSCCRPLHTGPRQLRSFAREPGMAACGKSSSRYPRRSRYPHHSDDPTGHLELCPQTRFCPYDLAEMALRNCWIPAARIRCVEPVIALRPE